jgi:hypothetical protein
MLYIRPLITKSILLLGLISLLGSNSQASCFNSLSSIGALETINIGIRLKGSRKFKYESYYTIFDLTDRQTGNLLLFRYIGGPYVKGMIGLHSNFEGVYSYSLDPGIAGTWGGTSEQGYIVVAVQNAYRDGLKYPKSDLKIGNNDPMHWGEIRPLLLLSDIAYYNEIDVPLEKENVILFFPEKQFLEFLARHQEQEMTAREIVEGLLRESR